MTDHRPTSRLKAYQRRPEDPKSPITSRQLEALRHAANGITTASIARRMGIGEQTAAHLLRSAYRKLGGRDRGNAIAIALVTNVLTPDDIQLPATTQKEQANAA